MNSPADQVLIDRTKDRAPSAMEVDDEQNPIQEQEQERDAFLQFIDYSKSMLSPDEDENEENSSGPG
ncbi:unnamed protein product [Ilex paraguariensis]|uniref:Uncharacterized protein n=1 Tax=Ilex paraguariensis TaxID=185542 RepID=A0ABC8R5R3_9AQUA